MLEVVEIEDGVFKVTLTHMHYDCMDTMSRNIEICSEAVLAFWIGSGMVELAGFMGDVAANPCPPAESMGEDELVDG